MNRLGNTLSLGPTQAIRSPVCVIYNVHTVVEWKYPLPWHSKTPAVETGK